jgi:ADP-heptose:LPS heptosyltransferase
MSRKVILRQGQSPGDILTMTRAVADLKATYPDYEIDVRTPCPELWENCPYLTPLDEKAEDVEVFNITYDDIHISGWNGLHFSDAFRHDINKKLDVHIVKTGIYPELWISDEEKGWINQVEQDCGWSGAFWLLNAGNKPDNELKRYHRWQEFADLFNDYFSGSVRLVQIGNEKHYHPVLKGVYRLVGKTDLRQLIRLAYWSHGTVGPISFQFVLAAAFRKPHVVVAGGKEGLRWHVYPNGRYLHTNGALNCCQFDGCWLGGEIGKCANLLPEDVPRCFQMITPQMILDALVMYYKGGILRTGDRGL